MPLPLTIAMDARWIFSSLSGIGRYTLELARALILHWLPLRGKAKA